MGSFLPFLALSTLTGVGLWFWVQYRKAMKRAQRAILDSQKRVLDAAQAEHDETDAEIDGLDGDALATAIDDAFPRQESDLHPDDAND
jgi:hypothetical protein